MILLNRGEFQAAADILVELIAGEPQAYYRYPRLAGCYAGLAEFDILKIATLKEEGGKKDSVAMINSFITPPLFTALTAYAVRVKNIVLAKNILAQMPAAERTKDPEIFYSASAELQYTLYLTTHSVMCINLFDLLIKEQQFTAQNLTPFPNCEATAVLGSLLDAAVVSATTNPELAAKISTLREEILAQEGASTQEKLIAHVVKAQAKAAGKP